MVPGRPASAGAGPDGRRSARVARPRATGLDGPSLAFAAATLSLVGAGLVTLPATPVLVAA